MTPRRSGRPYADPYLAGVGIGLVLLASFVLSGRGVGASGAFGAVVGETVAAAAPARAESSPVYRGFRQASPGGLAENWLVVEIVGVLIGGAASALLAGRFRVALDRGEGVAPASRVGSALAGGGLMGLGAGLARGCTSGQALSGGALLSAGSWLFIGTAFAGGYLGAPLVRGLWRESPPASPGGRETPEAPEAPA